MRLQQGGKFLYDSLSRSAKGCLGPMRSARLTGLGDLCRISVIPCQSISRTHRIRFAAAFALTGYPVAVYPIASYGFSPQRKGVPAERGRPRDIFSASALHAVSTSREVCGPAHRSAAKVVIVFIGDQTCRIVAGRGLPFRDFHQSFTNGRTRSISRTPASAHRRMSIYWR